MYFPGLELYRVESASRKYFRFHIVLFVREETMILNANWFGLELPFRYYLCWLKRLGWPMGYVYDPLNFERQEAWESIPLYFPAQTMVVDIRPLKSGRPTSRRLSLKAWILRRSSLAETSAATGSVSWRKRWANKKSSIGNESDRGTRNILCTLWDD